MRDDDTDDDDDERDDPRNRAQAPCERPLRATPGGVRAELVGLARLLSDRTGDPRWRGVAAALLGACALPSIDARDRVARSTLTASRLLCAADDHARRAVHWTWRDYHARSADELWRDARSHAYAALWHARDDHRPLHPGAWCPDPGCPHPHCAAWARFVDNLPPGWRLA